MLPFVDLSEKKDQEYFSDGLSEELIDLLTMVPDLRVPARTLSFYFKGQHVTIADIAKALSVAHLLAGSVRKAGNTIRVTARSRRQRLPPLVRDLRSRAQRRLQSPGRDRWRRGLNAEAQTCAAAASD